MYYVLATNLVRSHNNDIYSRRRTCWQYQMCLCLFRVFFCCAVPIIMTTRLANHSTTYLWQLHCKWNMATSNQKFQKAIRQAIYDLIWIPTWKDERDFQSGSFSTFTYLFTKLICNKNNILKIWANVFIFHYEPYKQCTMSHFTQHYCYVSKNLNHGGIRIGIFFLSGGCDDHCARTPGLT
jgi:hypothetical protein